MNLFWSTRSLTSSREDHLTEFFAAALELSQQFREKYTSIILDQFAEKNGWEKPVITAIETQVVFDDASCRPDMLIKLADGKAILCEHKIDALETEGKDTGEKDQLKRYLNLPVDGLVYVRASWKPPNKEVIENPKYIKPEKCEHFLWRDFYHILGTNDIFQLWIKEGFERLGFTPPHPSIGNISGDGSEESRRNFAKLWASTRTFANELGWRKITTGSIVELYLEDGTSEIADWIYISPRPDILLIRITPKEGKLPAIAEQVRNTAKNQKVVCEVTENVVKRKEGKISVIDITSSVFEILGKEKQTALDIEKKLFTYVTSFLKAIKN